MHIILYVKKILFLLITNFNNYFMKKLKVFIAALSLLGGVNLANAQTDVTSQYITNPGFEGESQQFLKINDDGRGVQKPYGWSVEWTQANSSDHNGMTYVGSMNQDGQNWTAYGDDKAYFTRMRWQNATLNLRQTMSNLRPGSYTLSFYATASKLSSGDGSASVSVAGQSQAIMVGTTEETNWTQYTIDFTVTSNSYATIEVTASRTAGNFKFGIDDFTLTYDGSSYYSTILAEAQALYDGNADWAENGLSDFVNAVTNATGKETVTDKNAAIVALETAMAAFKEANTVDVTRLIPNATFDSDINDWTTSGSDGTFKHQTSSQNNFTGGFLESWRNGWTGSYNHKNFDVYQTLSSLPNGEYTIKAAIIAVMQGDAESKTSGSWSYQNKKHGGPYYIDDEKGVWLYGTSGENSGKAWANTKNSSFDGNGAEYKTVTVKVENGSLTIGFKGIGSESGATSLGTYANWIACDNWTLSYFGFDPSTLLAQINSLKAEALALLENEDYSNVVGAERTDLTTASTLVPADEKKATLENAISQIEGAINAFTAAKANYDANAAEVTKATALGVASATISTYTAGSSTTAATALTNTQALKVAEYEYVTTNYSYGVNLGEWNSEGTNTSAATFNNEHWSGTTHDYMNQNDNNGQGWNAQSWSIDFNQDVTLPAGNYVFKVAGRQASGDKVNTSLVVKLGNNVLGTVNDFPRSNNSRGINKSGATAFEGENSEFANDGAGYGWEWRYVKFELTEDATVNIAINSVATDYHQWVSFGDYTLQTDNDANIALIAYNVALGNAQTIITDDNYANVTGSEKTALQEAIDADGTLDKTNKDDIEAATTALNDAVNAFTNAKDSYNALAAINATIENLETLPYADSSKKPSSNVTANSASDAEAKTTSQTTALRAYYESNAMAEGVTGSENMTISDPNMEVTYNSTNHTFGAWQVFSQTDGTISLKTENDQPLTDSEGNKYKYADIWKSDNNGGIKQSINLPAGKYLLTVAGRAQNATDATFVLFAGNNSIDIPRMDNTGGVFGNGWNDVSLQFNVLTQSDVEIGVVSGNGKTMWWGATRFRLVKLESPVVISENSTDIPGAAEDKIVTLERTLSASYWNTFSVPFDIAIPEGWTVKKFDSVGGDDNNTINFKEATTIEAGVPYLVKPTSNVENPTFEGVTIENTEGETIGTGDYKFAAQIYNKALATNGTIAYLATDGTIKKLTSGGIKGLRAYFIIPAGSTARIAFTDGDQTGIKDTVRETTNDNRVYDLQGRQVKAVKKGIYVVNGKKIIK